MNERILVVDDEEVFRRNLADYLTDQGYRVQQAADGEAGLETLRDQEFGLVLADIKMPGLDGLELLERAAAERPETPFILMTAYASLETAVEGFRYGAYDYVLKPLNFEDLEHKVENALTESHLRHRLRRRRREVDERLGFEGIVGDSPEMQEIFAQIEKVADLPTNVLITGESGTGKELVARAIHKRSSVAEREFLAVNMSAVSEDLIESQLFGAEKGAYTGATEERTGVFRAARGGTVFLDEIGDLPSGSQSKLLRAVEEQEVLPVGASQPVEVDFRLVAATNRDLSAMVEDGAFREDLYYRLNVFRIEIPPLRARREDIPLLVEHFAKLHARNLGRPVPTFSNAAIRALVSYDWPGNVRELSNLVERALILADSEPLDVEHLPDDLVGDDATQSTDSLTLDQAVASFEKHHIRRVLQMTDGNRSEAARLLDVDPATLYRRLSKYEIDAS